MKSKSSIYQYVQFERKGNPSFTYEGRMLYEDHESCVIGVDFDGIEMPITCYYDEWKIIKL